MQKIEIRGPGLPLGPGKEILLVKESDKANLSCEYHFNIDADTALISLFVSALSGGDLVVTLWTQTEDDKFLKVITFPTLSGPTTELLLKKAAAVMSKLKLVVECTGTVTLEVRARGLTAGETSVKILGASIARAVKYTVGTSTQLLLPASLAGRASMVLKNNSIGGTLYLGFTPAQATIEEGYPMAPGEAMGLDLESGVEVYAIGTVSIDVRTIEAAT